LYTNIQQNLPDGNKTVVETRTLLELSCCLVNQLISTKVYCVMFDLYYMLSLETNKLIYDYIRTRNYKRSINNNENKSHM